MKKIVLVILLLTLAAPGFASTHKESYNVPCNVLWAALKDTLRNSGKYGIIAIDNAEMTASYNMGGNLTGKRTNSAVLNSRDNGASCEMQIQTAFSGLANNDAGDLKKRVNASLARLRGTDATDFNMPPTEQNINKPPTEQMDAAQKAMAVAQASLAIDSTPAGADIEIDSAFVGNTPSTVTVDPGSHQIVVKKKGYADWVKTLTVTGGTIHLNAELETVQPQLPVAVPPPPRPN
ncbi:MAG: PEGA domain-containing protein [Terracidiphilus sp.]